MNNSMKRIRGIGMLLSLVTLSMFFGIGSVNALDGRISWEVCENSGLEEEDIRERVKNLSSIVDVRYTQEVLNHINKYLRYKKGLSMIIGRQMAYFPIFEDILAQKNLPTDLKYLTVVESALRPSATSRVGASGLWQLMRGTGRMLGLKINHVVDERRIPYRSTEAATEYLQMLYKEFDDWTLALAAYNSGPGRVRSAIRRSGSRDYWVLRRFLPKETRNYVPAYIAATYLSTYYYKHEVKPVVENSDFMSVSNIQIYEKISFKEIAEITGTTVQTIKTMNPGYLRFYVPENIEGHHVLLPNYATTLLLHHFYNPDLKIDYILPSMLDDAIVQPHIEMLRERIKDIESLPVTNCFPALNKTTSVIIDPKLVAFSEKKPMWYKLRKRESLRDVAIKHDIPLSKLISLNAEADGRIPTGRFIRLN